MLRSARALVKSVSRALEQGTAVADSLWFLVSFSLDELLVSGN